MDKQMNLIKGQYIGGRTISMYTYGDEYMVEVDYGGGYQSSKLVFKDANEATIRYKSACDDAAGNAEWVADESGDWHCSRCKAIIEADEESNHNWYFCYHCGAKMSNPYL